MSNINTIVLMIFSGLSVNLILQCALGIRGISKVNDNCKYHVYIKMGIIFFEIIFLWIVFSKIISYINSGIYIYILLFPVCSIVYDGFEYFISRYIVKKEMNDGNLVGFSGGIAAAALFITLNIANNFLNAVSLSFGFTIGILLAFIILGEIHKRAALEAVPKFLRGNPLTLISMGLLSLVFSGASLMMFRMFGG